MNPLFRCIHLSKLFTDNFSENRFREKCITGKLICCLDFKNSELPALDIKLLEFNGV